MRSLHIDFESFSTVDIKKAGTFRYWEEAEIMLIGYRLDSGQTNVIDLFKEDTPQWFLDALTDPTIIKHAFAAAFEIAAIFGHYGIRSPLEQWRDTQARAAMCGLPLDLDQAAKVLNLRHQKDAVGKALIRYFCQPCKPTKANGFRTRNLPEHAPDKWEAFKKYCGGDVDAECDVDDALAFYNISEFEQRQWRLDMEINQRGVLINIPFVRTACSMVDFYENRLMEEARALTGIDNPKSVAQLKKWLTAEMDEEITSLNKENIPDIIKRADSGVVARLLEIRQESSKTSTKKYPRMLQCICKDGRVRGVHHYYGANRTGRNSGRLIQTGNFPQGNIENIEPVRDLAMLNDPEWFEFTYGAIPDALSSLLRSALIPAPGKRFIIVDLASIESRVIAWLAGEQWVLEVFKTHGKIYEMTASRMFNVPLESIDKKSPYRKKGKVATLACGFQGAKGALIKMGALKEGLTEDELPALVTAWREANPNIVNLWYAVQAAIIRAIEIRETVYLHHVELRNGYQAPDHGISFRMHGRSLLLKLPSGRELVYVNTSLEDGEYGPKIVYHGTDQTTKKWTKLDTYGGKAVENIVQGTARDILMYGLHNMADRNYDIVLHVHDESVSEMPFGVGSVQEVIECMTTNPEWATGLPLAAEGCESLYYKK